MVWGMFVIPVDTIIFKVFIDIYGVYIGIFYGISIFYKLLFDLPFKVNVLF